MSDAHSKQRIDLVTVIGLGLLLLPLTTMWHEIGGHAAACAVQGGKVATIGAFYVDCHGLEGLPQRIVSCAGIAVDTTLSFVAWRLWLRARSDLARLILYYLWIGKGFVAAGYFLFSGFSGFGDLGTMADSGMHDIAHPLLWRGAFVIGGGVAYWRLVVAAIRALTTMLGESAETKRARRTVGHLFYLTLGLDAVLVGLLNPVGIVITILSAAASSFGGNAGFISVGFAVPHGDGLKPFKVERSWFIFAAGVLVSAGFALILGPSINFR